MEVKEQAPVVNKPSLRQRLLDRLLRGSPKVPVIVRRPEAPIQTTPDTNPFETIQKLTSVPEIPRLSREERRATKKEAYKKWKETGTGQQMPLGSTRLPAPQTTRPIEVISASLSETEPSNLPPGIKERAASDQTLLITPVNLPWIEKEVNVPLELMTLNTSRAEKFYYTDFIQGKKLLKAMLQMRAGEQENADKILFVQLSEFIQRKLAPGVRKVRNHITREPIFETGNEVGQRVYFMNLGTKQDIPVIVRIAVSNKATMPEVFSVITVEPRKVTKIKGKL